jgi:PHD/YefM family antitoxin component YafN of YafNO toxin-antitoxin module
MLDQKEPATQTMTAAEVQQHWSQTLDQVARHEARVIVERDGRQVAALISARDLARPRRYDEQRAEDFKVLDRIGAAFADVPDEELEREVAKALAEVRAEMRAEQSEGAARP